MKRNMMNAIYEREMKQAVRSPKFPLSLAIYLTILGGIGIFTLSGVFSGAEHYRNLKSSFFVLYKVLFGFEYALILFLLPGLTSSAISGERECGTLDVMLATTMSPYRIVIGKLLSAVSRLLFFVVASLPVLGLVFTISGINLKDLGDYILLLAVTALYIGSFGILMSVIFTKTTPSTVGAYAAVLFLVFGTSLIVMLNDYLGGGRPVEFRGLKNIDYLLLINPVVTIYEMMNTQTGVTGGELDLFRIFLPGDRSSMGNWFLVSLALQTVIAFINMVLAGFLLNPLRKK